MDIEMINTPYFSVISDDYLTRVWMIVDFSDIHTHSHYLFCHTHAQDLYVPRHPPICKIRNLVTMKAL